MQPPRLALLGAFAFPAPLGSQRFFAEQMAALRAAGAGVEPFTYGANAPPARRFDPRKLAADRALAARLAAAHRGRPFDAVLAHNAEAALVAFALRARLRLPVVYVAHTLWSEEAAAWAPLPGAGIVGAALDRALAGRADGVLALTESARRALAPGARGPLALVPPGHASEAAPAAADVAAACARRGLAPERFALYAGNLDRYQDLGVLDAAAAREPGLPLVAVSHDARPLRFRRLRVLVTGSVEEARLLLHGAAVAVLPRRRAGGFPIKLLHYMAARRAILLRQRLAGALVHGESAWLVDDDARAYAFAAALRRLAGDRALRERLGEGARRVLAEHHAWPPLATRTLALVQRAVEAAASR
jgi:glycosyltransferase involved in cell wall biosynthesis